MSRDIYSRVSYESGSRLQVPKGTSFPASLAKDGDLFFRSDESALYVFDGSVAGYTRLDPSGYSKPYKHTQSSASATWTIDHKLHAANVSVTIFDAASAVVIPSSVETLDSGTVKVTLGSSMTGSALVFGLPDTLHKGLVLQAKPPRGHDISILQAASIPVISHWPCLSSIVGGSSVPDVLGNHNGTHSSTVYYRGQPYFMGQPFVDDNVWLWGRVQLANAANIQTELRDQDWCYMCWAYLWPNRDAETCFMFGAAGVGETSATNFLDTPGVRGGADGMVRITTFWERGSATNYHADPNAWTTPGLHHLAWVGEKDQPIADYTQVTYYIDGEVAAVGSNPKATGGTSATGYFNDDRTSNFEYHPSYQTDMVFISGNPLPSAAQIQAQYQRGLGIY